MPDPTLNEIMEREHLFKVVCWLGFCKGVYILPLQGSGLDKPCPRCGRVRYIASRLWESLAIGDQKLVRRWRAVREGK